MAPVRTKRIYEPEEKGDGTRVLVMRLWPRGIRKERVDLWLKHLGADMTLRRKYKAGTLTWGDFRKRYLAGLESPAAHADLEELRQLVKAGPVTLLCSCLEEARCHRGILKQLLG